MKLLDKEMKWVLGYCVHGATPLPIAPPGSWLWSVSYTVVLDL